MRGLSIRSTIIPAWTCLRAMSISSASVAAKTNTGKKPPVAAIAQLRSTSDKVRNLLDIAKCSRMAKEQGACMIFLPECFGFIGTSSVETLENAEDQINAAVEEEDCSILTHKTDESHQKMVNDQLISMISGDSLLGTTSIKEGLKVNLLDGLRVIARESGLWISGGGMHVLGAPSDPESGNPRVYNTHIILDDTGEIQALYEKIHLFDVSIPGKVQLRESASTAPGKRLVVCDSPVGKLGLSTCYDVRFPEMYTSLVREGGAQVLLVPSAFTVPTGAAHWHSLLKCRAIENQCYVLAAAQNGRHNEKRESFGQSLAVDPWGKVLADAGGYPCDDDKGDSAKNDSDNAPTIICCEIDLDIVNSIRQRMPLEQHRTDASFSF